MTLTVAGAAGVAGLLSAIVTIASRILELADSAQRNVEKCKLLGERVRMISGLLGVLEELEKDVPQDQWTKQLLENLKNVLSDGEALVESCQKKRTWSRVFKTQKKSNKFDALEKRISMIQEQFHVANRILILNINNWGFFKKVLQKLLDNGACKRLPPGVKEGLKSSIKRLTNKANMSSNAQEMLEQIKRDIGCGDAATSGSSGAQRGDHLTTRILELTKDILWKAGRNPGNDIQRLAHLVQEIDNMCQTSELSLDPKTRRTLEDLQQDLQRISHNFVWYNSKEHNKVTRVVLCGTNNKDEVLEEVYKIECYIPALDAIALHQLHERNYMR